MTSLVAASADNFHQSAPDERALWDCSFVIRLPGNLEIPLLRIRAHGVDYILATPIMAAFGIQRFTRLMQAAVGSKAAHNLEQQNQRLWSLGHLAAVRCAELSMTSRDVDMVPVYAGRRIGNESSWCFPCCLLMPVLSVHVGGFYSKSPEHIMPAMESFMLSMDEWYQLAGERA